MADRSLFPEPEPEIPRGPLTDDDLSRMEGWALAASGHPTWSVAYARDVPRLIAEIRRLREKDA